MQRIVPGQQIAPRRRTQGSTVLSVTCRWGATGCTVPTVTQGLYNAVTIAKSPSDLPIITGDGHGIGMLTYIQKGGVEPRPEGLPVSRSCEERLRIMILR